MKRAVTTYSLEMLSPSELRPRRASAESLDWMIRRAELPSPELGRFLYTSVGGDWYWIDRLTWSYEQWRRWLDRPELGVWVGYAKGTPAGYFELERQPDENVEIAYFGLLPDFIGHGLGGDLLTAAIERAWDMKPRRVWVHTCTLDHPGALKNYLARGFRLFREETHDKELPESPLGCWPATVPTDRRRHSTDH